MSSSFFLCESKRKAVAGMHFLSGKLLPFQFFSQRKESCVQTHPTKQRVHMYYVYVHMHICIRGRCIFH